MGKLKTTSRFSDLVSGKEESRFSGLLGEVDTLEQPVSPTIAEASLRAPQMSVAPTGELTAGLDAPIEGELTEADKAKAFATLVTAEEQDIPVTEAEKKLELKGTPGGRIVSSIVGGAAGIPSGLLGAAEAVGIEGAGKVAENIDEWISEIAPSDPNFIEKLGSGVGSAAVFIPFGFGVGTVAKAIGTVSPKVASWFGASASALLEASTEAGALFNDTGDREAAAKSFFANTLLIGITNKFGIFSEKTKKEILKGLLNASLEGLQEAGQSLIESGAKGEAPNWDDVVESAGIGAIIGSAVPTSPTAEKVEKQAEKPAPEVLKGEELPLAEGQKIKPAAEEVVPEKPSVELPTEIKQTGVTQEEFLSADPKSQFIVKQTSDKVDAALKGKKKIDTKTITDVVGEVRGKENIAKLEELYKKIETHNEAIKPVPKVEKVVEPIKEEVVEPVKEEIKEEVIEPVVEEKKTDIAKLEEEYNAKSAQELAELKKKLYPDPDIESPMTPEEKLLNKVTAEKFGVINQEIKAKRDKPKVDVEAQKAELVDTFFERRDFRKTKGNKNKGSLDALMQTAEDLRKIGVDAEITNEKLFIDKKLVKKPPLQAKKEDIATFKDYKPRSKPEEIETMAEYIAFHSKNFPEGFGKAKIDQGIADLKAGTESNEAKVVQSVTDDFIDEINKTGDVQVPFTATKTERMTLQDFQEEVKLRKLAKNEGVPNGEITETIKRQTEEIESFAEDITSKAENQSEVELQKAADELNEFFAGKVEPTVEEVVEPTFESLDKREKDIISARSKLIDKVHKERHPDDYNTANKLYTKDAISKGSEGLENEKKQWGKWLTKLSDIHDQRIKLYDKQEQKAKPTTEKTPAGEQLTLGKEVKPSFPTKAKFVGKKDVSEETPLFKQKKEDEGQELLFQKAEENLATKARSFDNFEDFVDSQRDFRDAHTSPNQDNRTTEEKLEEGGDFSLREVAQGKHNQPDDYFDPRVGARYYGYDNLAGRQSETAINNIIRGLKSGKENLTVTTYRAVPNDVTEDKLIDRDWVTFSEEYAIGHGESRFGENEYKTIQQEVPIDDLWWDGNDINEWGYDTGKTEKLNRFELKEIYDKSRSQELAQKAPKKLSKLSKPELDKEIKLVSDLLPSDVTVTLNNKIVDKKGNPVRAAIDLGKKTIKVNPDLADLTSVPHEIAHAGISIVEPARAETLLKRQGWDGKGEITDFSNESLVQAHEKIAEGYELYFNDNERFKEEFKGPEQKPLARLYERLKGLFTKLSNWFKTRGLNEEAKFYKDLSEGKLKGETFDYVAGELAQKAPKKKKPSEAAKTVRDITMPIIHRVNRLARKYPSMKKLADSLSKMEHDISIKTSERGKKVADLLKWNKQLSPEKKEQWDLIRKNGDTKAIQRFIIDNKIGKEYAKVRSVLNEMFKEVNEVGLDVGYRASYHPRKVKDIEGFLQYVSEDKALNDLIDDSLTKQQNADKIANLLRGFGGGISLSKTSNLKERNVKTVTKELNEFYHTSDDALLMYIDETTNRIEERKFFSKRAKPQIDPELANIRDLASKSRKLRAKALETRENEDWHAYHKVKNELAKARKDSKSYQDRIKKRRQKLAAENKILKDIGDPQLTNQEVDKLNEQVGIPKVTEEDITNYAGGISDVLIDAMDENALTYSDMQELKTILRGRFLPSHLPRSVAQLKQLTYVATIGDIYNTATQLEDVAWSLYAYGLKNTIRGMGKSLIGQGIRAGDVGINSLAYEMKDNGKVGKAVNKMFKLTGFTAVDMFGKGTGLTSSLLYKKSLLKKNDAKTIAELDRIFGDDAQRVKDDILNEKWTDETKYLAFSALMQNQPIAPSSMPTKYNQSSLGKLAYTLQTFALSRMNAVVNDIIETGAEKTKTGKAINVAAKLSKLAFYGAVSGAGADMVKSILTGDFDDWEDLIEDPFTLNLAKYYATGLFRGSGLNKWNVKGIFEAKDKVKGFGKIPLKMAEDVLGVPAPISVPLQVSEDIITDVANWADNEKSFRFMKYVPILGKTLYKAWLRTDSDGNLIGGYSDDQSPLKEEIKELDKQFRKLKEEKNVEEFNKLARMPVSRWLNREQKVTVDGKQVDKTNRQIINDIFKLDKIYDELSTEDQKLLDQAKQDLDKARERFSKVRLHPRLRRVLTKINLGKSRENKRYRK